MTIRLYFDEDSMRHALVLALRAQGLVVTTALESKMIGQSDTAHLEYATHQGYVLCSFNRRDFYRLHTEYLQQDKSHGGILLANQQQFAIGETVRRLVNVSLALSSAEMKNRIEFLSAWG